VHFKEV